MEESSSAGKRSTAVEPSATAGCGALDSAPAASRSSTALLPRHENGTEIPRRDRLGQDLERTTAVARREGRLGDNPDVALVRPGRCACGNPGKPFVIIHGGEGYLCLTCFLREARSGRTPRASPPREAQLATALAASGGAEKGNPSFA
jgi:hypothetical protein